MQLFDTLLHKSQSDMSTIADGCLLSSNCIKGTAAAPANLVCAKTQTYFNCHPISMKKKTFNKIT